MKKINSLLVATLALAMLGTGCSKSSSSGGGGGDSALTISGTLSIAGSSSSSSAYSFMKLFGQNDAFAVTDYKIACATFEDIPKACGGDVGSDGTFSVSCSGFSSVPFGCFVFNSSTFANYPITFNINSGTDQKSVNVSGNVAATIELDLETGVATAAATVASDAKEEIAVDSGKLSNIDGKYAMAGAPYSEVSVRYTDEQKKFFTRVPCMMGPNNGQGACTPVTAEQGYNNLAQNMSGGIVELYSSTENSKSYLSAWDGSGGRAACGNKESGFTFSIDDGAQGQNAVTFDLSGSTQATLQSALGSSIGTVLSQWFPFLVDSGNGSTYNPTITCKYAANLDGDFWNNTPEMVQKCQNDNNCFNGNGDAFGALQRYKFKQLFNGGYSTSDNVLGAYDYRGKTVSSSASVKYGYRTWTNGSTTINEVTLENGRTLESYRVDLGGCIQWPNWQDTSSTEPKYATIVPVGDYVKYYDGAGKVTKEKCRMSEKRLLVEATDGYLMVGQLKYRDLNIFVDLGSGNFQETFTKVCEVDRDGDTSTANDKDILGFPADFTDANVKSQYNNQQNGGSAEQKKGMAMDAVYQLLTSDASEFSGNDVTFYYWDRSSNNGGQVACSEIKRGGAPSGVGPGNASEQTATWNKVKKAFDSVNDPWSKSRLLNCAMIAVANGKFAGVNSGGVPSLGNSYKDVDGNGLSDVVDNLKVNSCIPKFQLTQVCTDEGYCSPRVVCNSMTAANGGCDKAEPTARFAKMPAEALGGDKYTFMQVEYRYENYFDPTTNKSKQCTRTNSMALTTVNALASTIATGQKMRLSMERVESTVCDGESSKVMSIPPMFMDFTKQ